MSAEWCRKRRNFINTESNRTRATGAENKKENGVNMRVAESTPMLAFFGTVKLPSKYAK